ncbi:MAG: hypothetical protein MUC84_07075 [Solirubrobacteraceae bacterium]|nr:hypothetical protein [Solirubrobacteraceae bacterium]MCU0313805.1 hypothetical protein [Solirubrobacteraceae bacterium]
MIYSVVPEELGPELYEQLVAYYADDPDVTVIVDRRRAGRPPGGPPTADENPFRGRRRRRIPGDLPPFHGDGPAAA